MYYLSSGSGAAPPSGGPARWVVESEGKPPVPASITCDGVKAECSCVHAVPCAACHTTTTGGQKYIPPTAVELADCESSDEVRHIEWLRLLVDGDGSSAGMLMSGGLCLAAPSVLETNALTAAATPVGSAGVGRRAQQRVQPKLAARDGLFTAAEELSEVRVTVTSTHVRLARCLAQSFPRPYLFEVEPE